MKGKKQANKIDSSKEWQRGQNLWLRMGRREINWCNIGVRWIKESDDVLVHCRCLFVVLLAHPL
jgi:hypothetical protein